MVAVSLTGRSHTDAKTTNVGSIHLHYHNSFEQTTFDINGLRTNQNIDMKSVRALRDALNKVLDDHDLDLRSRAKVLDEDLILVRKGTNTYLVPKTASLSDSETKLRHMAVFVIDENGLVIKNRRGPVS